MPLTATEQQRVILLQQQQQDAEYRVGQFELAERVRQQIRDIYDAVEIRDQYAANMHPQVAATPQQVQNRQYTNDMMPTPPRPGFLTNLLKTPKIPHKPRKPRHKCPKCKTRYKYCSRCDQKCGRCCGCVVDCDKCRKNIRWIDVCRSCGICPRHCTCNDPMIDTKAGKINRLGRPLGVEFEMTNCNDIERNWGRKKAEIGHWEHDATITPAGRELVVLPDSGDGFLRKIHQIAEAIEMYEPGVNESCGFHVHVQSGDLNAWELRRLIYLWCRIEPDVYRFLVAPHRLTDDHCLRYSMPLSTTVVGEKLPWQFSPANAVALMRSRYDTANKIKVAIIKKLYQLDIGVPQKKNKPDDNYRRAIQAYKTAAQKFEYWKKNKRTPGQAEGGGCRYASMNLHSHFHRGTVEFRLKEGTVTPIEFIMWPLFCGWVVESIGKLTDAKVQSISNLAAWCEAVEGVVQNGVLRWVRKKMEAQS